MDFSAPPTIKGVAAEDIAPESLSVPETIKGFAPEPMNDATPVSLREVVVSATKRTFANPKTLFTVSAASAKVGGVKGATAGTALGPYGTFFGGVGGAVVGFATPTVVSILARTADAYARPQEQRDMKVRSTDADMRSDLSDFDKGLVEGMTFGSYAIEGEETGARTGGKIAGSLANTIALSMTMSPAVAKVSFVGGTAKLTAREVTGAGSAYISGLPTAAAWSISRSVESYNESMNSDDLAEDAVKVAAIAGGSTFLANSLFFGMLPGVTNKVMGKMANGYAMSAFRHSASGAGFMGYDASSKILQNMAYEGYEQLTGEKIADPVAVNSSDMLGTFLTGLTFSGVMGGTGFFTKKLFKSGVSGVEKRIIKSQEAVNLAEDMGQGIMRSAERVTELQGLVIRFGSKNGGSLADNPMPKSTMKKVITDIRASMKETGHPPIQSAEDYFNKMPREYWGVNNFECVLKALGM